MSAFAVISQAQTWHEKLAEAEGKIAETSTRIQTLSASKETSNNRINELTTYVEYWQGIVDSRTETRNEIQGRLDALAEEHFKNWEKLTQIDAAIRANNDYINELEVYKGSLYDYADQIDAAIRQNEDSKETVENAISLGEEDLQKVEDELANVSQGENSGQIAELESLRDQLKEAIQQCKDTWESLNSAIEELERQKAGIDGLRQQADDAIARANSENTALEAEKTKVEKAFDSYWEKKIPIENELFLAQQNLDAATDSKLYWEQLVNEEREKLARIDGDLALAATTLQEWTAVAEVCRQHIANGEE